MTLEDILNARIIPARAGFTLTAPMRRTANPDHPRSRGVYPVSTGGRHARMGSSPLARGLLNRRDRGGGLNRIIPARAGFTIRWPASPRWTWDHPRSRGVYVDLVSVHDVTVGSSPLARGLHEKNGGFYHVKGIIPARAGFTGRSHTGTSPATDHPRSRGVYVHG